MADAREDIDQQAIQELTNEVDALTKRVKQLELDIVRHKENENVPLEVRQRVFSWI
jgi:polyhydroxyalkanoate synthesis regulator phasin